MEIPSGHDNEAQTEDTEARSVERSIPRLELGEFRPTEVVALFRAAYQLDYQPDPSNRGPGVPDSLLEDMESTLDHLPTEDAERAIEVFTAFADSPLSTDREAIAGRFPAALTLADHDAGIALWDRLIRDADSNVRFQAHITLGDYLGDLGIQDSEPAKQIEQVESIDEGRLQRYCGLTRADARHLLEAYELAEQGTNQYDLGQAVLNRLVAAAETEQ